MLTGYGNLPTAVAAVKAGAIDYMAKPVDADDVEAALLASPESKSKTSRKSDVSRQGKMGAYSQSI